MSVIDTMKLPFELHVYVFTRPNLRDSGLEMEMCIGGRILECLFDRMEEFEDESVALSFPERWLNIIEQRVLLKRLALYGKRLKTVTIKTHSVYIVQCTLNTNCHIVNTDCRANESDTGKLYSEEPMPARFINPNGLTVL